MVAQGFSAFANAQRVDAQANAAAPATVNLVATPVAAQAGGRLPLRARAVILIDCSGSMRLGVHNKDASHPLVISSQNPQRWAVMQKELRRALDVLAQACPGIEVELRFFGNRLDCFPPIRSVIKDSGSVGKLLDGEAFARVRPSESYTALHSSIAGVLSDLLRKPAGPAWDWTYFVVISDGSDTKGGKPDSWGDLFAAFRGDSRNVGKVGAVGPEANAMLKRGDFGALDADDIDKLVPKPPTPRPKYVVSIAPPAQGVSGSAAIRDGAQVRVSCPVTMAASGNPADLAFLRLTAESPLQVAGATGGTLPWSFTMTAPPSSANGVSAVVRLTASSEPNATCDFVGEIALPVSYPPSRALAPNQWKFDVRSHVRRGEAASFAASVGVVKPNSVTWDFASPGGAKEEKRGEIVSRSFDMAGRWKMSLRATSEEGASLGPQPAGEIEVVDADFTLIGPAAVRVGEAATVAVRRANGSTSPATLHFELNGRTLDGAPTELALGAGETTARIPKEDLTAGTARLRVTSTSKTGSYEWSHERDIDVSERPFIGIRPASELREGEESLEVELVVVGEVGPELVPSINGIKGQSIVVPSLEKGARQAPAPVKILAKDFSGETLELKVASVTTPPPCDPATATVSMRRADLGVKLVSPLDGTTVVANGNESITLKLDGLEADRFKGKGIGMTVTIDDPGKTGVTLKATEDANGEWKVAIPGDLRPGRHPYEVTMTGGGLRPDIFKRAPARFFFDIGIPTLDIVQIPASTAGISIAPGKQLTLGLAGVPAADLDVNKIHWQATFKPATSGSPTVPIPVPPGATMTWSAPDWGSLDVEVVAPMVDGTPLKAKATIPVQGTSPGLQPMLSDSTPQQGTKSLTLSPGLTGDFSSFTVELWECDRSGKPVGNGPAWKSQEFAADPGTVDVPILPDVVGRVIEHFEVRVSVAPYPGDPKGPRPPVTVTGRLVPAALWHWWLLCVLAMLGVAWLLWKRLSGNEPLRWQLEFSSRNPGAASDAGEVAMSSVDVRKPCKHPDGSLPPYTGWNRGAKEAFIPLWLLKDRTDELDLEWLGEEQVANLKLRVKSFWSNPVDRVPGPDQGWAEADPLHAAVDGDLRFSCTKRLCAPRGPAGEDRYLYVRMRCPRGQDPLMWVFWSWCALTAVASAVLLPVFHMFNL